jgi:rare lipoprotein A (peptidoglycan hydrolase)
VVALSLALQVLTAPLTGHATWYGTGPGAGTAAAGPALRAALGPHWRGQRVRVCRVGFAYRCVVVRLRDWCWCPVRGRLVDLSDEDFRRLGPLWLGVVRVRVVRA